MRSRRFKARPELVDEGPGRSRFGLASLFLVGLIVGLIGGLYYAWVANPTVYLNASPARLHEDFKDEYIFLVSQSYAATGDWETAEQRLAALDDEAIAQTVAAQLERYLRDGKPAPVMNNLAALAAQLGVSSPAIAVFAPPTAENATPSPTFAAETATPTLSPTPTDTRRPTQTPAPTATPTSPSEPTAVPVFRLLGQERVCDGDVPTPRIEVVVVDALLEPLPGVEVLVQWEEGQDHFFTGFKPEEGLGYGDFEMTPDVSYSVLLVGGSPTVSGLRVEPCDASEGGLAGGWRLSFQNTEIVQATPEPEE